MCSFLLIAIHLPPIWRSSATNLRPICGPSAAHLPPNCRPSTAHIAGLSIYIYTERKSVSGRLLFWVFSLSENEYTSISQIYSPSNILSYSLTHNGIHGTVRDSKCVKANQPDSYFSLSEGVRNTNSFIFCPVSFTIKNDLSFL